MNYVEVSDRLRKYRLYLFGLKDLENLFPRENQKTIKNNLTRWIAKGYLERLKRDIYELVDKGGPVQIPDLYVACKLYEPSYVSLETALSIYGVIPDIAAQVTSVTTRPTRTFKNRYGSFFYRTCRKKAFTGYRLAPYEGYKVFIADKEKALVDFIYYRHRFGGSVDFDEERLNKTALRDIDWKKAARYARLFNHNTANILRSCKEYVLC